MPRNIYMWKKAHLVSVKPKVDPKKNRSEKDQARVRPRNITPHTDKVLS